MKQGFDGDFQAHYGDVRVLHCKKFSVIGGCIMSQCVHFLGGEAICFLCRVGLPPCRCQGSVLMGRRLQANCLNIPLSH